jgi:hypothetical protein
MAVKRPYTSTTFLPAVAGMRALVGVGGPSAANLIDQPRGH